MAYAPSEESGEARNGSPRNKTTIRRNTRAVAARCSGESPVSIQSETRLWNVALPHPRLRLSFAKSVHGRYPVPRPKNSIVLRSASACWRASSSVPMLPLNCMIFG